MVEARGVEPLLRKSMFREGQRRSFSRVFLSMNMGEYRGLLLLVLLLF
jgi:hypothetical protein